MTITMGKPGRAKPSRKSSLARIAPVAMLALLASPAAKAAWKFTPIADVNQTYTDNVSLATDEFARGQFVTDIAPGFTLASNGPRLKLLAAAQLHYYAFAGSRVEGTNRTSRRLQADAKSVLVDDRLFLDASASIGQQSISAFGQQIAGNSYASANRSEVKTYRISPYLVHKFSSRTRGELRYAHDSVDSGNAGLGHSVGDALSASLSSDTAFRKLGWKLSYYRQKLDDSIARESNSETASADLRFQLARTIALTGGGGYDRYDYDELGGKTRGAHWSSGFVWTPSSRTSVEASGGQRYFGPTKTLRAVHRSRHTVWSVNYRDAITTTRSRFLLPATIDTAAMLGQLLTPTFPDPLMRQQAVEAYMRDTGIPGALAEDINYFSNRYILEQSFQASAAFKTARTTLVASVFDTQRTALSASSADSPLLGSSLSLLNDNTKQVGANLLANYRLSPRSAINGTLTSSRVESLTTGFVNNHHALRLGMTRQFSSHMSAAVEVRHVRGTAAVQSGREYRENAVTASLSMKL